MGAHKHRDGTIARKASVLPYPLGRGSRCRTRGSLRPVSFLHTSRHRLRARQGYRIDTRDDFSAGTQLASTARPNTTLYDCPVADLSDASEHPNLRNKCTAPS